MKKSVLVLLLSIVLVFGGGMIYFFKDAIFQKLSRQAVEEERKVWQQKTEKLENEIALLEHEIGQDDESRLPDGKIVEVFGTKQVMPPEGAEDFRGEVQAQVLKFFSYLDQKGYGTTQGFTDRTYEHFLRIVGKLEQTRPVITGETQDLYTLLKNITYFYRILGDRNIKMIKDILSEETEILEPTMELFFAWMNPWQAWGNGGRIGLSPEAMYEYASFFLQTISGQSYLMRRSSQVRTLTIYYCVLILDRANDEVLNKYGIDIRPPLDSLMDEIESNNRLLYQRKYLIKLSEIKMKY